MDDNASKQTRGKTITALNDLEVGMYAHAYKNNAFQNDVMTDSEYHFVNNEELEAVGTPVMWSEVATADKLRVYGYAPYGGNFSPTTANGATTITHTVPTNIADQPDIIATDVKEVASTYRQNIPLTFQHILTGVRFKVGFDCTVKSLTVQSVYQTGTYIIGEAWTNSSTPQTFTIPIESDGRQLRKGDYITEDDEILMMIPQQLPDNAQVVMEYVVGGQSKTIIAPLKGFKWEQGTMVTYTIHENIQQEYVYFDLYAGNVTITQTSYTGYVYVNGVATEVSAKNTSTADKHFYVYQSTAANKNSTGYATALNVGLCRLPSYAPVKVGNQLWSDYITNNTSVEDVIEMWDDGKYVREDGTSAPNEKHIGEAAVRDVERSHTKNYIMVKGKSIICNLTIDNIYSTYQELKGNDLRDRNSGGISYIPTGNSTLTINLIGDSRVGCVHVDNTPTDKIIFEGQGSLTAANADFITPEDRNYWDEDYYGTDEQGYISNHRKSAIGNDTYEDETDAYGITINSGVIFAGTTKIENCSAIGGGGNCLGQVYINGGVVTAVATTTGTAIGGGIGFSDVGGEGDVNISGGSVYAYNFANRWDIPSSAIGGGGSKNRQGKLGKVNISGGYVYAYSALGTAIGGGSSKTREGGLSDIIISGGYIIAKSEKSSGIGGGIGGTGMASDNKIAAYGGSATITISGNPVIRTGSIGGGKTNNPEGKIGHAEINISGNPDISAQFVMAGGADANSKTTFTMSGGTISNSDYNNNEFYHVAKYGGAVYMEDGEFDMSGGTIRNCSSEKGGAVYISKSANAVISPLFKMSGGLIESCESETHGGAVYLEEGTVVMSGGTITKNLARKGNGGGIYIVEGDFTMSGANTTVSNNSALNRDNTGSSGNGGGIYVSSLSSSVNVTVESGNIINNTCNQNGGGICVDMSASEQNDAYKATIKIGDSGSGPKINSNKAILYGGGLYAIGKNAEVTIDGGSIKQNSVANYVPNEDVANEGGTVELKQGDVTHVVVTFDVNTQDTSATVSFPTQNIVTSTNSFLVTPEANRPLYTFVEWNSRADGEGTTYKTGDLMNISDNMTLYAQWKAQ